VSPRWYLWCAALAVTCANLGGQWDIAWHRSIGRDGFWSAPHIVIYLCGVLAGVSCGYLILSTTFGMASTVAGPTAASTGPTGLDSSVRVWGFRGPLGAFLASWGGFTMLASAPFDNWWHAAYGLDVKILSPPHVVLMGGAMAVQIGALLLILGEMNRAADTGRRTLEWLYLYVGGMILASQYTSIMEYSARPSMHLTSFYLAAALVFVPVLVAVARASSRRWATTQVAAVYSVFFLAMLWILPLQHAEPKLGPVYHPVTTLIPAGFPLLLIVPAIALDLLRPRLAGLNRWLQSLALGAVFLAFFTAAQWPFAEFLNSPAAHNAFFGSSYLDYRTRPTSYMARNAFFPQDGDLRGYAYGFALALLGAALTARLGIAWGDWMRKIRRLGWRSPRASC
jgi:hypothetical protein